MAELVHINGYDCGLTQVLYSDKRGDITCLKCKKSKAYKALAKGKSKSVQSGIKNKITHEKILQRHKREAILDILKNHPDYPKCNLCCLPMVIRENKRTKEKFWGCTGYPDCKNTMPYNDLK